MVREYLEIQLVCFSRGTYLFQALCSQEVHDRTDTSCPRWAYRNASHTGDTLCSIYLFGVGEGNGIRRTFLGADAAMIASVSAFGVWHHAGLFVRVVAGYLWHRTIVCYRLAHNFCTEMQ